MLPMARGFRLRLPLKPFPQASFMGNLKEISGAGKVVPG
jgi:hypothetical protein